MNLPNKLTVLRMCMVPVFLFLLCVPLGIPDATLRIITAVIFILTSLTDMIDGKIARHFNMISTVGHVEMDIGVIRQIRLSKIIYAKNRIIYANIRQ